MTPPRRKEQGRQLAEQDVNCVAVLKDTIPLRGTAGVSHRGGEDGQKCTPLGIGPGLYLSLKPITFFISHSEALLCAEFILGFSN